MPRRLSYLAFITVIIVTLFLVVWQPSTPGDGLTVDSPIEAIVFDKWEATLTFSKELKAFNSLSSTQVNDAYDADRNGQFIRIEVLFTHSDGHTMRVPSFAMKDAPDSEYATKCVY